MTAEAPALPVRALQDAMDAVVAQRDLEGILHTVAQQAADLTGADAGAVGLLGDKGEVLRFVTSGSEAEVWERVADGRHGALLVVPVQVGGTDYARLYLTGEHAGAGFTDDDESVARLLADTAGLVIGHRRADVLVERRRRWLEAATDLARALAEEFPLEWALAQVTRRARAASGARAAAVVGLPHEGPPTVRTYDGPADLVPESSLQEAVVAAWAAEPVAVHPELAVVPLGGRLTEPSALVLVMPPDRDRHGQEHDLLAAYADQAGLALDRAQAVRDREKLAVVTERERIARELHDTIVQRLFAAGLLLQTVRVAPPDRVGDGLDSAVEALDAAIREIRGTVLDLQG